MPLAQSARILLIFTPSSFTTFSSRHHLRVHTDGGSLQNHNHNVGDGIPPGPFHLHIYEQTDTYNGQEHTHEVAQTVLRGGLRGWGAQRWGIGGKYNCGDTEEPD